MSNSQKVNYLIYDALIVTTRERQKIGLEVEQLIGDNTVGRLLWIVPMVLFVEWK